MNIEKLERLLQICFKSWFLFLRKRSLRLFLNWPLRHPKGLLYMHRSHVTCVKFSRDAATSIGCHMNYQPKVAFTVAAVGCVISLSWATSSTWSWILSGSCNIKQVSHENKCEEGNESPTGLFYSRVWVSRDPQVQVPHWHKWCFKNVSTIHWLSSL